MIATNPTLLFGAVITNLCCKTFYPEPSHICGMAPRVALITGAGGMLQLLVTAQSGTDACLCACHRTRSVRCMGHF